LTLLGIAEDAGPDGPVRTAIISSRGGLFHVSAGEQVGERYRVAAVSAADATLVDLADGATFQLTLR
jgi:hypothetical protein